MALKLNFSISQGCDGSFFTLTETTGDYSNVNVNGWEAPNASKADIEPDTVDINITDTLGNSYSLREQRAAALTDFPETVDTVTMLPTDIGLAEDAIIPDGTYSFVYSITVDGVYYERALYFYFDSQAKCCVDKMFADIKVDDCCCDDSNLEKALKARGLLIAASYAGRCGQITKAAELLAVVNKLCNHTGNCSTC